MNSVIGFLLLVGLGLIVASVAGAAGPWAAMAVAGVLLVALAVFLAMNQPDMPAGPRR